MQRVDISLGPDWRLSAFLGSKGIVLRLLERNLGRWVYRTPEVDIDLDELRAYEGALRSSGAEINSWTFGPIGLSWEWQKLHVALDGEEVGHGDRSLFEAGVRRVLAGAL